jgi:protein-export membrane protein SecD
MTKSRPLQYLGLFLLVAASLAVIFFPVGTTPEEQPFTIAIRAPKPWLQLADPKTPLPQQADDIFAKAFSDERLPGELTVSTEGGTLASGSTLALVEDRAATQAEARRRANKVLSALQSKFKGIKLAPATDEQIRQLPAEPLLEAGPYAVFPPLQRDGATVPAVKLGLDLQGGVNLVLQIRKALFTYNFDQKIGEGADARYQFTARVRDALQNAGNKLNEADVNLRPGQDNVLEIRTQAASREEFNAQKKAIDDALKSISDVKFTLAREPQFFQPEKGQNEAVAAFSSSDLLNNMVEIVRSRVDKLGVSEPQIQAQPPDRVIVQLPGVNDPQKAVEAVGRTAQMEIRLMPENVVPVPDPNDSGNTLFRDQATGQLLSPEQIKETFPLIVSGDDLKPKTTAGTLPGGQAAVFFELQPNAARRFGEMTARNVGRIMPIFLDERCITAPNINEPITGGSGQISGSMTIEEAKSLAVLLNSGALPAPIDIVENRTVSATLGADSLRQSLRAGLIGLIAVMVFMIVFYRLPGLLANFALIIYCLLNLAAFILLGGTLTLPGVAGFLLALAMSLDTNILIFERLKEEMAIQPNFASALRAAFSRAWTAILDSHITTLIAATVLFYLGTGPVKGFALTLGVGVLLSLFSAISVTRLFLWSIVHIGEKNHSLFAGNIPDAETVSG